MKRSKKILGVGINDADYRINISITTGYTKEGKQIQKRIWSCPYYKVWIDMLRRGFSENLRKKIRTYKDVEIQESWLYFSQFRAWAEPRYAEGLSLDKDILVYGNKIYSENTCCFVPHYVNTVLLTSSKGSNELIGAIFKPARAHLLTPYMAASSSHPYLGYFSTAKEAHHAWQADKVKNIISVVNRYREDESYIPEVADALLGRARILEKDMLDGKVTEYV